MATNIRVDIDKDKTTIYENDDPLDCKKINEASENLRISEIFGIRRAIVRWSKKLNKLLRRKIWTKAKVINAQK